MVTLLITVLRAMPATNPVRPRGAPLDNPSTSIGRLYRGGSDVDDAAELARHHCRPPSALISSIGVSMLASIALIQSSRVQFAEIARRRAAGIVDQDIRIRARLQRGLAAIRRGDVAGDFRHRDTGTGFAYFGGGLRSASAPRAVSVTCTPSAASAMAQARPNPLLDAHTSARRPLIPRSTVSLPCIQRFFEIRCGLL